MGSYTYFRFFFVSERTNTIVQKKLSGGKKGTRSELTIPNEKEIRATYEMMTIYVIKKSGYDIDYVNRMPFFEFKDLFDTLKNIDK